MALNPNVRGTVEGVRDVSGTEIDFAIIERALNVAYYNTLPLAGELGDCGGTAVLAEIQNFLAAHFIAIGDQDRQTMSESIAGEASAKYAGVSGMGLEATTYGQQAIALDCSGKLARAGLKRASFTVWAHEDFDYAWDPEVD